LATPRPMTTRRTPTPQTQTIRTGSRRRTKTIRLRKKRKKTKAPTTHPPSGQAQFVPPHLRAPAGPRRRRTPPSA
jgi:hypothetical protein